MTTLSPAMLDALRWPERATVSEWADRHRVLDQQTSAEPGPWRTDRVPYVREWHDSAQVPWVRQVTIQKSTQVGGTEAMLNVLAYAIEAEPGPITWVMPSREDAEAFGENRVMPMVRACLALRRQLTGQRWDAKRRRVRFRRCTLHLRTARVPSELASVACRWLFGDEVNKWPTWTQREAGPWELALERTRTFWNYKAFMTSTPTVAGGLISREFEKGDRRRYHVPCPHCGTFQVLRWSQVRWPKEIETEERMRAARTAWYECEACHRAIDDREKAAALARGFWCPEAVDWREHLRDGQVRLPDDRNPHRSYHLWAGYSPWVAWWEMAAKFLRSRDDPAQLQNFVNSWLGEPWEEKVEEPKVELLRECVTAYSRGTVPEGVLVLTAGADVQKHSVPFVVRGWGLDRESWLLDHGRAESLDALGDLLFRRDWTGGDDRRRHLVVRLLMIDARYRTPEVVDFARRWGAVVKMSFGVEREDPRPFSVQQLDRHPATGAPLQGVQVWHVNTPMFKDQLAHAIRRGGEPGPGAFHLYQDVDEQYLLEVTAEHKVLVRTGNRERERWQLKAGRRQNHYLDAEALAFAAAQLLRVETMRADLATAQARHQQRQQQQQQRRRGDGDGGLNLWRRR